MRFVAPCGHEGVPVTANFVTCTVCDRLPMKVVAEAKPPTLTWKTLRQYRDELLSAYGKAFGANAVGLQSGECFDVLAETQAEQLYELQEFVRSVSPETFL